MQPNAAVSLRNITLRRGAFLEVRHNNSKHLLPTSEAHPLDFPKLIVSVVFGTGASLAAGRVSVDSAGQNYLIAVPAGEPLSVLPFSRHFALADVQGKPLPSPRERIDFQALAGSGQTLTFNVVGPSSL